MVLLALGADWWEKLRECRGIALGSEDCITSEEGEPLVEKVRAEILTPLTENRASGSRCITSARRVIEGGLCITSEGA
jgi:hypothetical protein